MEYNFYKTSSRVKRYIIALKTDMYSLNVRSVTTGIYALLQNTSYTTTSSFCVDCSQLDNRKIVCKKFHEPN